MQYSITIYPDLDQLVRDLLYLDEIEDNANVSEEEKMHIKIFVCPKLLDKSQSYLWRTII